MCAQTQNVASISVLKHQIAASESVHEPQTMTSRSVPGP